MLPGAAFHIAPRALDLERGFSPAILFADSVRHVIDGHVAGSRYYEICSGTKVRSLNEATLERRMRELFSLDLNPLIAMTRQLDSESAFFKAWNTYQKYAGLAVRTIVVGRANDQLVVDRRPVAYRADLPAARDAALCAIDILRGTAKVRGRQEPATYSGPRRVSELAARLGLEGTAVAEVVLCLEEMRGLNVAGLCRMLGCQSRSLQRQLRRYGITALEIKIACALAGATNSLWGGASLTEIAADYGFSDQAHMTHAFRNACGMPPSVLRQLVAIN